MEKKERYGCFFVGDYNLPGYRINTIRQQMREMLEKFVNKGILDFFIGGDPGFETLAAEEVVRFRMRFPEREIRLVYLPPSSEEYAQRSVQERNKLDAMRWTADQVFPAANFPAVRDLQSGKKWMADHSVACVTYFSHTRDCNSDIIQYAQRKNVYVVYLAKSPANE